MRTLGKVLLAPTLASGLIAAGTGAAQAAPTSYRAYFRGNSTPIQSAFTIGAQVVGYGNVSDTFYVSKSRCDGYPLSGNPCWDKGTDLTNGAQGWVWVGYLAFS
jgi:hypothetical protein